MGSFVSMYDYGPRGVVSADEMDKIRENIEYLHEPNYACSQYVGADVNITSTSWVKVSANFDFTIETFGGPIHISYTVPLGTTTASGVQYFTIYVDGVNIGNATYGLGAWGSNTETLIGTIQGIYKPAAGVHTVSLYSRVSAGTWTINNAICPVVWNAM